MLEFIKRRWFLLFILFFFLSLLSGWLLVSTEFGLKMVFDRILPKISEEAKVTLKLGEFTVKGWGILEIAELSGNLNNLKMSFSLKKLRLEVPWETFLSSQPRFDLIECEEARISGKIGLKILEDIPEPPPFGCFADWRLKPVFKKISIKNLEWEPDSSASTTLKIIDLNLLPEEKNEGHPISFAGDLKIRGKTVLSGSWKGKADFRKALLRGNFNGMLLGKPFETDFLANAVPRFSLNGHLKKFETEIGLLSRWFGSWWQKETPLAFEGAIGLEGSWMIDSKLGFSGNLHGTASKVRLFTTGFVMHLLEINSDLVFSQVKLKVLDKGSNFVGFPAKLEGEIRFNWKDPSEWKIDLDVPVIEVQELIASMPWTLRYSAALPELSGSASLNIALNGTGPTWRWSFQTSALKIMTPQKHAILQGKLDYQKSPNGASGIHLQFRWDSAESLPPVLSKMTYLGKPFSEFLKPPVAFEGTLDGPDSTHLELRSRIISQEQKFEISGRWSDKSWFAVSLNGISSPAYFDLGCVGPGALLLLSGK